MRNDNQGLRVNLCEYDRSNYGERQEPPRLLSDCTTEKVEV